MQRSTLLVVLLTATLLWKPLSAAAEAGHESATASHAEGEGAGHEGAEHGEHGELTLINVLTSTEFIASIVNFAALIAILVWLGRKPLKAFLTSRRKTMEDGMAEAARIKEAAQAKYNEYSDRLAKLDDEIKKLTNMIMQTARDEKDRISKDADARSVRLRQDTERLVDQQMKQLYSDVMREVVDTAMSTAESVLRNQLNSQDQQRLAQDFLAQLAKTTKREGKA
jgi:F-type H+-transporting ATPase subunit b